MWSIIIGFALSIAIALLTPKPKIEDAQASGLEDFSFPTVSESRPITILWGTRKLTGPNVGAYGNLKTVPIEEEVKTGIFSSDDVIVGYKYFIDIAFFCCFGPDVTLLEIDVGDFNVFQGSQPTEGKVFVNKPNIFGNDPSEGGVQGNLQWYVGSETQTSDPYLNSRIRQQPGFKNIAYGVWEGGYVGNSTGLRPFSFVLSRFPDPFTQPDKEINGDANPAYCIYEILTNDDFGKGYPVGVVDGSSFIAAAATLATEGLGVSLLFDQKVDVDQIVRQLEQHINGNIYFDPQTGRIKLNLVRQDFDVGTLPVLDETNIRQLLNYNRGGATNLVTEVKVRYIDRSANFKDRIAASPDTGTRQILSKANSRTLDYLGFSNATTAGKIALRELLPLGAYLATANVWTNRDASEFFPGQPVKLSWSPLGIVQLVMRVKAIDIGTLEDGTVKLGLVEDAFAVGDAIFDDNPASGWQPINNAPTEIINFVAVDTPFYYLQGVAPYRPMFLAEQLDGDSQGYNIFARNFTLSEADLTKVVNNLQGYTPLGQLAIDLDQENTATLTVKNLDFAAGLVEKTLTEILQNGNNLALIYDSLGKHEFIAYEGFTIVSANYEFTGVQRGMLDTTPKDFSTDTFIWFLNRVGTGNLTYADLTDIRYKLQSVTSIGEFDIAPISETPLVFASRQAKPYPPGRFYTNGLEFPGEIATGDLTFTWAHRAKSIDLLQTQDDNAGTLETNVSYTIEIRNESGTLIRTYSGLTGTSQVYPRATLDADNGGSSPLFIDVTAYAVDSGVSLNSLFPQERLIFTTLGASQFLYTPGGNITTNQAGFGGDTFRNIIPASNLIQSGAGTVRLTVRAISDLQVDEFWISHQAASGDAYDFDGNQAQVTWNTGNAGFTLLAGNTLVSDDITFDLDKSKNLIFSFFLPSSPGNVSYRVLSGCTSFRKAGVNDASTEDATGYSISNSNRSYLVELIIDPTL